MGLSVVLWMPIYFTTDVNSLPMEKWSHPITRVALPKTWFTIQSELGSELVSSNVVSLFMGSWTPRNGLLHVAQHPMDVERIHVGVCPSTMVVSKALRLVPSLKLVQVFEGENIELKAAMGGIFKPYHIAQAAVNATVAFRPDCTRHCLWRRSNGPTTYVRSCSYEIYCP